MPILMLMASCKSQDPMAQQIRDTQDLLDHEKAAVALLKNEFVLEADYVTFKNGKLVFVDYNTNFVSVDGTDATIQLAFNSPYAGPNGIGGITLDGRATNIKSETDKKGNIHFTMNVTGTALSATVMLDLRAGSNQCDARIMPNFSGNVITFSGKLRPKAESGIFKGSAI